MRSLVALVLGIYLASCGEKNSSDSGPSKDFDFGACSASIYTHNPVDLNDIEELNHIGFTGGSTNILPKGHGGMILKNSVDETDVRIPGRVYITSLRSDEFYTEDPVANPAAVPTFRDYGIEYKACTEVSGHLGHIAMLEQKYLDILNDSDCRVYQANLTTWNRNCNANVSPMLIEAGEKVGRQIRAVIGVVDWGTKDKRVTNTVLNSLFSHITNSISPYVYADSALQAAVTPLFDRQILPVWGEMIIDEPGTLQGIWVPPGFNSSTAQDAMISFIPDSLDATKQVITAGTSVVGFTSQDDTHVFSTVPTDRENRKFSTITPDGETYCFTISDVLSTTHGALLVRLENTTTLSIEFISQGSGSETCAGAVFTGARQTFTR